MDRRAKACSVLKSCRKTVSCEDFSESASVFPVLPRPSEVANTYRRNAVQTDSCYIAQKR